MIIISWFQQALSNEPKEPETEISATLTLDTKEEELALRPAPDSHPTTMRWEEPTQPKAEQASRVLRRRVSP